MLVLSRKSQESVVIGGAEGFEHQLKVTVLEISRGKVRLGFEVDKGVRVFRWEVWQRIRAGAPPPAAAAPDHGGLLEPRPDPLAPEQARPC